jgi:uncharacterized protein YgfB (UPF0149 family)
MSDNIDPALALIAVGLGFRDKKKKKKKQEIDFSTLDLNATIDAHFDEEDDEEK